MKIVIFDDQNKSINYISEVKEMKIFQKSNIKPFLKYGPLLTKEQKEVVEGLIVAYFKAFIQEDKETIEFKDDDKVH